MGVKNFLRNTFKGKQLTSQVLAGPGWETLVGILQRSEFATADTVWKTYTVEQLEQIYAKSTLIFACVREITTSLSEAPPIVGHQTPDGWEPEEDHWLPDLLRAPNPDYDYTELLDRFASRLLLTGKSFIWKWRNRGGRGCVAELWPLPTHWVIPKKGVSAMSRLVTSYTVKQLRGEKKNVDSRDMLYARFTDPHSTGDGIGPLQVATRDHQLDTERQDYLIEMLTNLKVPGIKITVPHKMTPDQETKLRHWVHDRIGKGARGNPLVLEGEGAKAETMAPLADMDWPKFTSLSESRICMAFGVSPILVGARIGLERATYANYQAARYSFYMETMIPMWKAVAAAFTRSFLRHEGEEKLELRFDYSEVAGLQAGMKERAERAKILVGGSIATRNEGRKMAGLPPDPAEGDVYLVPAKVLVVPAQGFLQLAGKLELPKLIKSAGKATNPAEGEEHGHAEFKEGTVEWHFHNHEHGYQHCEGPPSNPYTIKHVGAKHVITKEYARGHGQGNAPVWFKFETKLKSGWALSSGTEVGVSDVPDAFKHAKEAA